MILLCNGEASTRFFSVFVLILRWKWGKWKIRKCGEPGGQIGKLWKRSFCIWFEPEISELFCAFDLDGKCITFMFVSESFAVFYLN